MSCQVPNLYPLLFCDLITILLIMFSAIWNWITSIPNSLESLDVNLLIVLAITVSTIIQLFLTWWLNRVNYRDKYYRILIDKRLEGYQPVENLISLLNQTIVDNDKRYLNIFQTWGQFQEFFDNLMAIGKRSYFLDEDIQDKLSEFNEYIRNKIPVRSERQPIEFGIEHYQQFVKFRFELENLLINNLLKLGNLRKFRNQRKTKIQEKMKELLSK